MFENIEKYIYIFFIYSFLGWCMETFGGYVKTKKLVNRGFLIGPYCPVYGVGVVLITVFLSKYVNDIPIMFFMSILICGNLEYFTSYFMEKFFNARWWDYHNKKFNINGRICLETLIPFGIAGVLLVKFVSPFFLKLIFEVNEVIRYWILGILCIIFVIDVIVSLTVIIGFKRTARQVEGEVRDNTEEISKMVKNVTTEKIEELIDDTKEVAEEINHKLQELTEKVKERLLEKSWLTRRLTNAFPELKIKFKNKK